MSKITAKDVVSHTLQFFGITFIFFIAICVAGEFWFRQQGL